MPASLGEQCCHGAKTARAIDTAPMKVAIFGASGRLGSAMARLAAGQQIEVIMHVRNEAKAEPLRQFGKVVVGPIGDAHVLAQALGSRWR